MFKEILLSREKINAHYALKYINFISSRTNISEKGKTDLHHILPKSADMFPEYKNLKDYPWNGINLTYREHFIAHKMLHRLFKGSSQSIAFFNMSNTMFKKKNSKAYQEAKEHHIENLIKMTQSPARNRKISEKLSGKKKSVEHIRKLMGHSVSLEARQKLRDANLGKKHSVESKLKMSLMRKGTIPNIGILGIKRMSESKTKFLLKTPKGVFKRYEEVALVYGEDIRSIFQKGLNKIPKNKKCLKLVGYENINKQTWRELGFDLLQK